MAARSNPVSQQDIISGLKFSEDPHKQGMYLAEILQNERAEVSDVAQAAIKTTFDSVNIRDASLVLPTLFELKKSRKMLPEGLVGRFCKEVDNILGPDHLRRTIPPEQLTDRIENPVETFLESGLAARDKLDEKLYFLANALISNYGEGWSLFDEMYPFKFYSPFLPNAVVLHAQSVTFNEGKSNLIISLEFLLRKMTGEDSDAIKTYGKAIDVFHKATRQDDHGQQPVQDARADETCVLC